ncbi:unnamed protein product [Caenorhabditis nigoni]
MCCDCLKSCCDKLMGKPPAPPKNVSQFIHPVPKHYFSGSRTSYQSTWEAWYKCRIVDSWNTRTGSAPPPLKRDCCDKIMGKPPKQPPNYGNKSITNQPGKPPGTPGTPGTAGTPEQTNRKEALEMPLLQVVLQMLERSTSSSSSSHIHCLCCCCSCRYAIGHPDGC